LTKAIGNKEKILNMLRGKELTVKEIARSSEFNENETRVYIHRLKKENEIKEVGKEGRSIIYTTGKISKKPPSECITLLKFLNDFFKSNVSYLLKNEEIKEYILQNEEFDKIEEMIKKYA
jgi:hypothetical protein